MVFRLLSVAVFATCFSVTLAQAQSLRPSEAPPAGFSGAQYVDSRGCVFLRAGIGGRVNWVARISANRKPLCGYPPTAGAQRVAIAADPAPAVQAPSAPAQATAMQPAAPRVVYAPVQASAQTRQATAYQPAPVARPAAVAATRANGCPARSPYGKSATLSDGRSTLVCSADPDFDLAAAVSRYERRNPVSQRTAYAAPAQQYAVPRRTSGGGGGLTATDNAKGYYAPSQQAAAPTGRVPRAAPQYSSGSGTALRVEITARKTSSGIPAGYKAAFKDDRFNPRRGQGSTGGWAQQDQVWSRDIPSTLLVTEARVPRRGSLVTSTSNAPREAVPAARNGRFYIQVGTFSVAKNAQGTAARLSQAGLPVASSRIQRNGRNLQIVMAGPFATEGQARSALGQVRSAGFGDAFIR